jgi:hypothetical protein
LFIALAPDAFFLDAPFAADFLRGLAFLRALVAFFAERFDPFLAVFPRLDFVAMGFL